MKRLSIFFVCIALIFSYISADAQCVMCKAVAEDAADAGGVGRGLNIAILYLMAVPYIILTTLYFTFFRKKSIFNG